MDILLNILSRLALGVGVGRSWDRLVGERRRGTEWSWMERENRLEVGEDVGEVDSRTESCLRDRTESCD